MILVLAPIDHFADVCLVDDDDAASYEGIYGLYTDYNRRIPSEDNGKEEGGGGGDPQDDGSTSSGSEESDSGKSRHPTAASPPPGPPSPPGTGVQDVNGPKGWSIWSIMFWLALFMGVGWLLHKAGTLRDAASRAVTDLRRRATKGRGKGKGRAAIAGKTILLNQLEDLELEYDLNSNTTLSSPVSCTMLVTPSIVTRQVLLQMEVLTETILPTVVDAALGSCIPDVPSGMVHHGLVLGIFTTLCVVMLAGALATMYSMSCSISIRGLAAYAIHVSFFSQHLTSRSRVLTDIEGYVFLKKKTDFYESDHRAIYHGTNL